jgi:hypothetical protein
METYDTVDESAILNRLAKLDGKLDELEEYTAKMSLDLEEMKVAVDHLEASFLDEIAKSAKTKFDSFRDYLASKIKP